jgi:hypothetical protein
MSNDLAAKTIAIFGATVSGKTCFAWAVARQIRQVLSRQTKQEMSLEWDDDESREFYNELNEAIVRRAEVPAATLTNKQPSALRATVRFPVRGWWRSWRQGSRAAISLVFPDPTGEFFINEAAASKLEYLDKASAYLLMVDPFTSRKYCRWRREQGLDLPRDVEEFLPAEDAMGSFVKILRRRLRRQVGVLDRILAIALTKCDEPGLFDPDGAAHGDRFPPQGRDYDPSLAKAIRRRVRSHLEDDLDMPGLTSLAKATFRHVGYFATSALGHPPERNPKTAEVRIENACPRRVEEPLLWILHRWGYL